MTGRFDSKRTASLLRARLAVVWLALALLVPAVRGGRAAEPEFRPAPLSENAQEMLESFGLRELAAPPVPSSYFDDLAASRSLQGHILCLRGHYLLRRNQLSAARRMFEDAPVGSTKSQDGFIHAHDTAIEQSPGADRAHLVGVLSIKDSVKTSQPVVLVVIKDNIRQRNPHGWALAARENLYLY